MQPVLELPPTLSFLAPAGFFDGRVNLATELFPHPPLDI